MPATEVTFELLDGNRAAEHAADLRALHEEVYGGLPYDSNSAGERFADQFRVLCRQPGFVLAEARSGGYLVGYATGMPLRPSSSWWRGLTTTLPDWVTAEHPGRTFALTELLVRASWRRQGIGRTLHDLALGDRQEERAAAVVPQGATAAHAAFQSWGWHKVARARSPRPGAPASDILVTTLAADSQR